MRHHTHIVKIVFFTLVVNFVLRSTKERAPKERDAAEMRVEQSAYVVSVQNHESNKSETLLLLLGGLNCSGGSGQLLVPYLEYHKGC